MSNVTEDIFRALAGNQDSWNCFEPLRAVMALQAIDSPLRQCHFLSQFAHETQGFTRFEENLNYSADGLANTWPSRYAQRGTDGHFIQPYQPNAKALSLHRKPQAIANDVYANRMGNGPPSSGEGWRHRGQGIPMLTGKENFANASLAVFLDTSLLDDPGLIRLPEYGAQVAGWYWSRANCNAMADADDVVGITKAINGGLIGLAERKQLLAKAKAAAGI
ncbi:MAG TPA: glycoside hydrolase family 19 protein [Limnobacter sp.]|uniref:glycoside hydrolase family 19 protein n=1 Tax=Limnobacter sp. TaxID=2003368 RepID=UPI002E337FF5|nr:glycoside hydrolase family 19 protein [Limnobacter sp.]HEX5486490.1 glycoside hydrolase family 19 protein [Limnobacter sp.]